MKWVQIVLLSLVFLVSNILVTYLEFMAMDVFWWEPEYQIYFFPAWLLNAGLYYFLIMRERKSDKFYLENETRMKYCFVIQLCIMLISIIINMIDEHINPLENPPQGMDFVILFFFALPLPVMCWLRGWLFRLMFIRFPNHLYEKITHKNL